MGNMNKFTSINRFLTESIINILLLGIFFLICMGMGYGVLNRFDPGTLAALNDTAFYSAIVINGIDGVSADFPNRILVPYLGHLIYLIAPEIQSWNMVNFSLLVVNSFFTALSTMLILNMSLRITRNIEYSIISCLFFLLNFHVINLYLVSYIDSAYGFSLLLLIYCLLYNRLLFLPLVAIFGCLVKEVFLPIGSSMLLGSIIFEFYKHKNIELLKVLIFILFMMIGLITITSVDIFMGKNTYLYWNDFTNNTSSVSPDITVTNILTNIIKFMFTMGWVIILAVPSLKKLPPSITFSSMFASIAAIFLGWVAGVGGADYARFIYVPAAFIISLASAISISEIVKAYKSNLQI